MPRTVIDNEFGRIEVGFYRSDWESVVKGVGDVFKPGRANRLYAEAINKGVTQIRRAVRVAAQRHRGDGKTPSGEKRPHLYQAVKSYRAKKSRRGNIYGKVGILVNAATKAYHAHLVEYGTYRGKHPLAPTPRRGKGAGGPKFVGPKRKTVMTEFMRTGRDKFYPPHKRSNHAKATLFFHTAVKTIAGFARITMTNALIRRFGDLVAKEAKSGGRGFRKEIL